MTIRNERQFQAVNVARDPLPLYVSGVLSTSRSEPLTVAVAVNGIVAAVTHSYRERDTHMFATLIPETSLRNGDNAVSAIALRTMRCHRRSQAPAKAATRYISARRALRCSIHTRAWL